MGALDGGGVVVVDGGEFVVRGEEGGWSGGLGGVGGCWSMVEQVRRPPNQGPRLHLQWEWAAALEETFVIQKKFSSKNFCKNPFDGFLVSH